MKNFLAAGVAFAVLAGLPGTLSAQTEVVVWVAGEPGQTTIYDELAEAFNAKNPDAKITVVKNSSDLFNPALIPALSAGEGPDLFTFGTGPGQPAALIAGGLVADLTDAYFEHGWGDTIPEGIVVQTSSDGKLWAFGNEVETTGMFYNKAIFAENGIEVPTTWAEMEAAVAKLQEAGFDTPIGLGAADKWPISHWQSMMFGRYAGPEGIEDVLFGDGEWTDAHFVAASAKLQEMGKAGWFGSTPVAIGYGELMDRFWAGEIPMTFTGPWVIGGGIEAAGDRIGDYSVFAVPPFEDGQKIHPTNSIGSGWYIRQGSEGADIAVQFLNSMFLETDGRVALLNAGTIPVGALDDALAEAEMSPLAVDIWKTSDDHAANGTVPAFLDTITPGSLTTVSYDGLQALLLDVMTPEEFTSEMQSAWSSAKEAGEIMLPGGIAER
ncbi:extracellular solute-binding protein [Roseibium porphyridii]|uniref:Extracellular solute-binding protein n=1 Tax=Roseibium porphyridii TaxID=2866279 RepID=A0ABY8FF59_9HYPH|nr:extracellular solute-binding protein [Roseibium sp. KMA01]WFE91218.1 extracellular solute-binding protein [Roseibium sp. KMA01]